MKEDTVGSGSRYRAPALEKGLQILELLAGANQPLTMSQLSECLGRSKGEIFRMVQVLETSGYIARRPGEEGYALTNRLFTLGMEQPPVRGLIEAALPLMQQLAQIIQQSCHLVVPSREQIVVIARVDSPGEVGFAVRLGHRRPLHQSTSGRVLFASQTPVVQADWMDLLREFYPGFDEEKLLGETRAIAKRGHAREPSAHVAGVTDLSTALFTGKVAVATLTVPYVKQADSVLQIDEAIDALKAVAGVISHALDFGDRGAIPANGAGKSPPRKSRVSGAI